MNRLANDDAINSLYCLEYPNFNP